MKVTDIHIPAQAVLSPDDIVASGTVTNASISLNNYNRLTNPYEYTTSTPSDSTKWITVKGGKLSFTQKKPFSGTIYIRQKGVNENKVKHMEMKMPSNYIAVSYDAASQQWVIE